MGIAVAVSRTRLLRRAWYPILKRPRSSRAKFTLMAQQGELVFAIPTFSGITGSDAGSAVDRRCAENRIRLFRYAQSPIFEAPKRQPYRVYVGGSARRTRFCDPDF